MNKQTIIETIKTAANAADARAEMTTSSARPDDRRWMVVAFGAGCPLSLEVLNRRGAAPGEMVVEATHLLGGYSRATLTTEAEVRGYIIAWVEAVQERYNRSKAA